jgi:hypothetical protein
MERKSIMQQQQQQQLSFRRTKKLSRRWENGDMEDLNRASRHSLPTSSRHTSVRERQSWASDLETGIDGGMRGHCATVSKIE